MTNTMKNRITRALSRTGLRARALATLAAVALLTAACDVHGISDPGTLASITVTPNATMATASTQQMIAVGRDAEGRTVTISPVWSVAASGGTINGSGMFTAGSVTGVFTNTVVATVGTMSGRASITVTPGPLATITLVPNPVTLPVTTTQQFVAIGYDATGNIVQLAPSWSILAGGGTVNSTGLFTAGNTPGTYTNTVQVSQGGIKALATVNVTVGPAVSVTLTPSPATLIVSAKQQFVAVARDAGGNAITSVFAWSVVAGGGAIDGAGLFTAGTTPGTYANTVRVTTGTLSANATVVVTAGPLATITVTPNPATMTLSATQQFTAVGRDVGGNTVAIVPVWDVVAGGGTINSSTGLFTAGTVSGTFTNTVRASAGGLSGFASVIITTGPLATITVTPNPVSMPAGSTQQFIAVGRDANNNVFVMSPVWSVVNSGGTINASGLFTAGATAGTFNNTVQATSGTISGTATVTVTVAPPPPANSLGLAAPFGILAGSGISCAISGTINGTASDIGSSPTLSVTGFPPCTFTGSIPSPAVIAAAKGDLTVAYLAAQGIAGCTNLTGFDLGFYDGSTPAKTLGPGTYCFSTSAALTGTLKLTGSATDKWTFQIGSTLNAEVGSLVILAGVPADNVTWAVGTSATLKTNSAFKGNILALTSITLQNGATLLGRALAQNGAVDMTAGAATITKP